MKTLHSIFKLMGRFDCFAPTLAVTLLGGIVGGTGSWMRLVIAILSNLLLFTFAIMYRKIETAPAAALSCNPKEQNPIASGEISLKLAKTLSAVLALLCLSLAALLGLLDIVLKFSGVLIAIALSHQNLNLGNSTLMRIGKHQPLFSVIFGLSGYLASAQRLNSEALLLTIFLMALSFIFAAWTAEKSARPLSKPLLILLVVFASAAAYMLFIVFEVIPAWVLLLIVLLSAALLLLKHHFNAHQQGLPQLFYDSLAISTALSLTLTYVIQLFL